MVLIIVISFLLMFIIFGLISYDIIKNTEYRRKLYEASSKMTRDYINFIEEIKKRESIRARIKSRKSLIRKIKRGF